ncbi:glycosyltransferase family protein [Desulfovibrio sp. SGI.169]|uniref:glycosyltransferase family protein n=1 Tax=Desulfovibrio sp. SGI.169 TaxID=3420561 RepID=UPI003D032677
MKLRILSVGGQYLTQSLRQLGHAVISVCSEHDADIALSHPKTVRKLLEEAAGLGFTPDVLFYADDGNLPSLIDPESASCPSIYYSIDTYCNPWHLAYARGFDLVLAAQKDFLSLFSDEGMPAQWFPLFCRVVDAAASFEMRDIPVAFVGTLGHKNNPERATFLQNFRALQPLVMRSGDFFPVFRRSRIVLNQTAFSEVNFRCFEAMGCGSALLMERCANGLDALFTPGENILPLYTRNNAAEAARIASAYLARPRQLAEIAENGRSLVAQRHSSLVRSQRLAEYCRQLIAASAQKARLAQADLRRNFVRTAFGMIASELCGPQWERHRRFFHNLATR